MVTVPTVASKVFRSVRAAVGMAGVWTMLRWLLEWATVVVEIADQSKGRCLAILHKDGVPENDKFINIDIRVMGQTVLLGWIQIL